MLLLSLAAIAIAANHPLRILFIGNSHTQINDLPGMVKSMLESDGSGRQVETYRFFDEFLNDAFADPNVRKAAADPRWDVVVLQAAKASSSHKFRYNNDGAAALARMAIKAGSRTLFFVEWPRRGWDESEFQMGVYRPIQQAAPGSELVPVCYAWDSILKQSPNLELWAPDGNHASPLGTYLAANVFYFYLAGEKRNPTWTLPGIDPQTNHLIRVSAQAALRYNLAKQSA